MVDFITRRPPMDQSEEYGETAIEDIFTMGEPPRVHKVRAHTVPAGPGLVRVARIEYLDWHDTPAGTDLEEVPWWAGDEISQEDVAARVAAYLDERGYAYDRIEIVSEGQ